MYDMLYLSSSTVESLENRHYFLKGNELIFSTSGVRSRQSQLRGGGCGRRLLFYGISHNGTPSITTKTIGSLLNLPLYRVADQFLFSLLAIIDSS